MDLKSALCRYLIQQKVVGSRVYQKRLPQRDGSITGGLPAIVVSLISDRHLSSSYILTRDGQRCVIRRQAARVQLDVIGNLLRDSLEQLKERLIITLSSFQGDLWGLQVESTIYLNSYDQDLIHEGHDRIVSDYKVIYRA